MSAKDALLLTSPIIALSLALLLQTGARAAEEECDYGPPNLIKVTKTPFGMPGGETASNPADSAWELGNISLSSGGSSDEPARATAPSAFQKLSIKGRLAGSRLYMPERMMLGMPAKFTVKAKPGMTVAIAMADRDKGSKPVAGHQVRLGPDRKVVAISKVPDTGLAEIYVETPIEGDLIGQFLYFEAALWSKDDMSDLELAQTVSSATTATPGNAVLVAQAAEGKRRGVNIVPDSAMPLIMRQGASSLSSGQP